MFPEFLTFGLEAESVAAQNSPNPGRMRGMSAPRELNPSLKKLLCLAKLEISLKPNKQRMHYECYD